MGAKGVMNPDSKKNKTIRLRPSITNKLKEFSKLHSISEIDIITNGLIEYMDKLEKVNKMV